jgi:hypothetical protein
MIELLVALFLKFWMFLFGMIRGAVSAVPFLRRWLLSGNLESEFRQQHLVLHADKRDLLLSKLRVFAVEGTRIVAITDQELLLSAGETHQFRLPDDTHACVLMTELVDINTGRHTQVHRRLEREAEIKSASGYTS